MPDREGRLYLFEALALRDEYDQRIALLEKLLDPQGEHCGGLRFGASDSEVLQPAVGFEPSAIEAELKKLKTRRIKLNQEIQIANFHASFAFDGEEISLAQALEVRKALIAERDELLRRVVDSAYKRVIHKEERDVIKEPTRPFQRAYDEYHAVLYRLRTLMMAIRRLNQTVAVAFRED
jgi:hypothetical protein